MPAPQHASAPVRLLWLAAVTVLPPLGAFGAVRPAGSFAATALDDGAGALDALATGDALGVDVEAAVCAGGGMSAVEAEAVAVALVVESGVLLFESPPPQPRSPMTNAP